MIGAHSDPNLENIFASPIFKPCEIGNIRLEAVASLRVVAQSFVEVIAICIDLTTRSLVPEFTDPGFQDTHITHVTRLRRR